MGNAMQLRLPYELFHFPLRNGFCQYFDLNWAEKEEGGKFNQKVVKKLGSLKNLWTVPLFAVSYTVSPSYRQIVEGRLEGGNTQKIHFFFSYFILVISSIFLQEAKSLIVFTVALLVIITQFSSVLGNLWLRVRKKLLWPK